ncbi:MAG: hypothetical protein ACE3L7_13900 [Candidatus Pristimantibacillus sp.]
MNELYTVILKTGDSIVFKTDMPKAEVEILPIFPNQYKFFNYFRAEGYRLEIDSIIKRAP